MDSLNTEIRDRVATLTIDRPALHNAIDLRMIRLLHDALDEIDNADDGPRAVVITGSHQDFCSGLDLHSVDLSGEDARQRANDDIRRFMDPLILRLSNFRYPIIAAVNGPAIGAGLSLALASDIIVASEDAYFLPSFVRLGLIPDCGITFHLARRIGSGRALASLMLSKKIDAQTAFAWGLVYAVMPRAAVADCAHSLGRHLAAGPASILSQLRILHGTTFEHSLLEQVEAERHAQTIALRDPSCVEGVTAFFEHREPIFAQQSASLSQRAAFVKPT